MSEYLAIAIFICVSIILSLALGVLPMFLAISKPDSEKLSTYECGFNPLSRARKNFDIKFYLVSILFMIFDLEIAFLFPCAISLSKISYCGFWSMMIFLAILTVGFIHEWCKGALEWGLCSFRTCIVSRVSCFTWLNKIDIRSTSATALAIVITILEIILFIFSIKLTLHFAK